MEPKEKKTDNEKRIVEFLPTDLTTEILLRLPGKSVARFSCVSKLWSSITTDPSFISSFQTRSARQQLLLLCFQKDDQLFVSSMPHQNSNMSYSSSLSFDHHHTTKFQKDLRNYSSTESVHGLICFHQSKKPIVWNPSTRQIITLPTIPKYCKTLIRPILFLGYDPIEGKHKVVCIPCKKTCNVCGVFILGSDQESWRTVKINHKHRSSWDTAGRCIDGVIYYLTFLCQGQGLGYVVMSFDVRSEKFNMIKPPSGFDGHVLITYKGRLACCQYDHSRFWILEDAQKHKWSSQDLLSTFGYFNRSMTTSFNLTGFSHAGEFIYVPIMSTHLLYILLFDPVRNSWRRFELKGMADAKSISNDGVPMYWLHAFPNHIDSYMSL